jgi:hypothetical protein
MDHFRVTLNFTLVTKVICGTFPIKKTDFDTVVRAVQLDHRIEQATIHKVNFETIVNRLRDCQQLKRYFNFGATIELFIGGNLIPTSVECHQLGHHADVDNSR